MYAVVDLRIIFQQQKMVNFPFTIATVLLSMAILTSKFQEGSTRLTVAFYSLLGTFQTGSLILTLAVYLNSAATTKSTTILLILCLSLVQIINIIGFLILTPYLLSDRKFMKWVNRRTKREECRFNLFWFFFISFLSLLTNYKLKMVIFCRLFSFNCFDGHLEDVNKFKIFDVLSLIGLVPQAVFLYCAIITLVGLDRNTDLFFALIDALIIFGLNIISSVAVCKKQKTFFVQQSQGVSLNQIYNVADEQFQNGAVVTNQSNKRQLNANLSSIKLEDISQYDEFAYRTTKRQGKARRKLSFPNQQACKAEVASSQNTVNVQSQSESNQQSQSQHKQQPTQSPNLQKIQPVIQSVHQQKVLHRPNDAIQNIVIIDQNLNDQSEYCYSQQRNQQIQVNRTVKPQNAVQLTALAQHYQSTSQKAAENDQNIAKTAQLQTHIKLSDYLRANRYKQIEIQCNSNKKDKQAIKYTKNQQNDKGRSAIYQNDQQKPIRSKSREVINSYHINTINSTNKINQQQLNHQSKGLSKKYMTDDVQNFKTDIQNQLHPHLDRTPLFENSSENKLKVKNIIEQLTGLNRRPKSNSMFQSHLRRNSSSYGKSSERVQNGSRPWKKKMSSLQKIYLKVERAKN